MNLDKLVKKAKTIFWTLLISATLFLAVTMSAMRIMMPHLAAYIPEIEAVLSQQLNADVTVERMDTGWQGFGPAIRFEEVEIYQPETELLLARANHLDVQLNVWASVLQRQWVPGRITLDGMVLTLVKTDQGTLTIQGFGDLLGEQSFNVFDLAKRFRRVDIKKSFFTVDLHQGEPIDLELVYFSLSPRGGDYRLEADLRQQEEASRLTVIADLRGEISRPNQLLVDGYINLQNITYDERYMDWKTDNVAVEQGQFNLSTWFKWRNGQWQQIIGESQADNFVLSNGEQRLPLAFSADIAWEQKKHAKWELTGDDIILEIDGTRSPLDAFVLNVDDSWDFKLNAIAADEVFILLDLADQIPESLIDFVENTQPGGELKDIQIIVTREDNRLMDWSVGLWVEDWHQQGYGKIPAFKNFSGELMLKQDYGQFRLSSENIELGAPHIFSSDLNIRSVEGLITWHVDEILKINASDLRISTEEFTIHTHVEAQVPEDKTKTHIALTAKTSDFTTDVGLQYLPEGILPIKSVNWLYGSLERGNITDMQVILDGPIMEFPFRQNQGEFELRISGTDIDLLYHKDWPMLQDMTGEVVIDTKTVQAVVDTGYFYHSGIEQAKVLIKLAPKPEPLYLAVSGIAEGPVSDIEHFLQRSPLWSRMAPTFEQVTLEGPVHLDLDLNIPLRAEKKVFNIAGVATMTDGQVQLKKWNLPFSDVNGALVFTEKTLSASNVQGTLLGSPARLDITPTQNDDGHQMNWLVTSKFTSEILDKYFPSDLWALLSGESEYSAQFSTYIPKRDEALQIEITSDLEGMEIKAPAPLGKVAEEKIDTRFAATFVANDVTLTRFELGDIVQALVAFDIEDDHYQVDRGHIVLGGGAPQPFSESQGLDISGELDSFRLDDWLTFMKGFGSTKDVSYPELDDVRVHITELQYQNYTLNNATVALTRAEQAWNFELDSEELLGEIRISDNRETDPLIFDMQRCDWPALRSSTTLIDDPSNIIAFDFTCHDMSVGDRELGYVRLATVPNEKGVEFNPIIITTDVGSIEAKASWENTNGTTSTHFSGTAATQDLSRTLDNLGFDTDIRDAKGDLEFDLTWPGSPLTIDKEKLSGQIDAHLSKGRIVEVNPGFGRILGLMSLQGLQRRLRLDFSDVFKEGFSFDTLDAKATIAQGKIYTKNAEIKAPSAKIDISGQAGLVDEELDFNLYLKANIDPTIPAAAIAIANPIAGAAVWVAGKMINPLGSRAYYHYHVTGTWDEPEFVDKTEEYREQMSQPEAIINLD